MILLINNKCDMQCPHCMQDSNPDGDEIDMKTVYDVCDFINRNRVLFLIVSGGEPTMHSKFDEIIDTIINKTSVKIIVASNGSFFYDVKRKNMISRMVFKYSKRMSFQISSFKEYYKNHEAIARDQEKIVKFLKPTQSYIELKNLRKIVCLGRAANNDYFENIVDNQEYKLTSCINGYLVGKQSQSLKQFIFTLEASGYVCIPMVDTKGMIHLSESRLCPTIGHVSDNDNDVIKKICSSEPCGKCYNWKYTKEIYDNSIKLINIRNGNAK